MNISAPKLIFSILTGYVLGMFIFFFDNAGSHSSFDNVFSDFPAAINHYPAVKQQALAQIPALTRNPSSQLWFFREQPMFLIWAIMHSIGAALCLLVLVLNVAIQKEVFQEHLISKKHRLRCVIIVVGCVTIIMAISYLAAYGVDYVSYLIPLNHSGVKIYSFEGLNYIAGAYCLVNMMWIAHVVENKGEIITPNEFARLKKLFNMSLFMVSIVIAYATLNSGILYKALNSFYYKLYDPTGKSDPYFPVYIIISLGLLNTFLLCMFYFPNLQVFKRAEERNALLVFPAENIKPPKEDNKSIWGITSEMLETVKIALALLSPLLSGLFS